MLSPRLAVAIRVPASADAGVGTSPCTGTTGRQVGLVAVAGSG